jgi:hypothetical protein
VIDKGDACATEVTEQETGREPGLNAARGEEQQLDMARSSSSIFIDMDIGSRAYGDTPCVDGGVA